MGNRQLGRRPAGKNGDGVFVLSARQPGVNKLRLGGQELRLSGDDVGLRACAGGILVLRDVQRPLILLQRVRQQIVDRVGLPQLHIGERERGLGGQRRVGEFRRADLGRGPLFFDGATYFSPDVERPAAANLRVQDIDARVLTRETRVVIQGRIEARAGFADERERLPVVGLVRLQGLVRDGDHSFQAVEFTIPESLPPLALCEIVARRTDLPALEFLVLRGNDSGRLLIIRSDRRAAREGRPDGQQRDALGKRTSPTHAPAIVSGAFRK